MEEFSYAASTPAHLDLINKAAATVDPIVIPQLNIKQSTSQVSTVSDQCIKRGNSYFYTLSNVDLFFLLFFLLAAMDNEGEFKSVIRVEVYSFSSLLFFLFFFAFRPSTTSYF